MISQASVSFLRISPRKVRYVIDLIRAKSVPAAWSILSGSPRRAGGIIEKLLNQAVDAAQKNSQISSNDLFISKVTADGGPSMRRFRAASMGRASIIKKRTSHIILELDVLKGRAVKPVLKKALPSAATKKTGLSFGRKKLAGAK